MDVFVSLPWAFILGVDDRYGDVFRQGCPCVLIGRVMCFLELECLLLRNDRKTSRCDHFPHVTCVHFTKLTT